MSDPMNPAAPAARARPSSVTISSYLLYLVAALLVIGSIASLSRLGALTDALEEVYAGTDAEGAEGFAVAVTVGAAVLNLLIAAGLVVLALFNNRGRNGSRIATWIIGGIGVCCTGLGLAGTAAQNSLNVDTGGNVPDAEEIQRRTEDALGWVGPFSTVTSVISLLALLGALILLALPPSNEFFRKKQAAWEPPIPGYPGYPPAGPQAGGQPPYGTPGGQQPPYGPPGGQQPPYPPSGGQQPPNPPSS